MNRLLGFALFTLVSLNLYSAQYLPLDTTQVLRVDLSSRHHNRIGIIDERIQRAFFKNDDILVEVEDLSGQIFIQSLKNPCSSTTISIVSSAGEVQELELNFIDCPSEIILLSRPVTCKQSEAVVTTPFITDLINGYMKGELPIGYLSIEDPESPFLIKRGLKIQRINRLVNDQQIVFVYRLQNESNHNHCVTECQVNVLDGDWVFLDRYELKPQESALVLIGCMRC